MTDIRMVLCTAPDKETAQKIARTLVEQKLAACVNLLSPCESVYRWEDRLETATEIPMMIKTTAAAVARLSEAIIALHPYDVPEILALPAVDGLPAYLNWVRTSTD